MVSTRKKRQSSWRLLSELDDSHRDIICNAVSDRRENVVVNEGTVDQEFTVNNSGSNLTADDNLVNVKTSERCFNEWLDREINR